MLMFWNTEISQPQFLKLNVEVEILEGDPAHDSNHGDGMGQGLKAM